MDNNQTITPTSQPIQRLFIISLTTVVILTLGLVTIVVVSVIPHFSIIGWVATGVVIVCLVCVAIGVIAFTFSRIGLWQNQRNILHVGEVVVLLTSDGKVMHLSAAHERAKVPQIVQALPSGEEEEELPMAEVDIIDLYNHGSSERTIAEAAGMSRHQVRKVLDKQKGKK